ncbi:MAG: flagellar export protein FliJ [Candidatus Azotimanducaceae bacterium]|jgi:flagellar export protein FliJ
MKKKRPKSSLHTLLNISEIKENDAVRLLVTAQKVVDENQKKLNELEVFLADYQHQPKTPVHAHRLQSTRQFLIQLSEVIQLQKQQLELSKCAMLKEKDNWIARRIKRKSVEKIAHNRFLKIEKAKQKKEEAELDEMSSQFKTPFL